MSDKLAQARDAYDRWHRSGDDWEDCVLSEVVRMMLEAIEEAAAERVRDREVLSADDYAAMIARNGSFSMAPYLIGAGGGTEDGLANSLANSDGNSAANSLDVPASSISITSDVDSLRTIIAQYAERREKHGDK